MTGPFKGKRKIDVPCTIEIENTFDSLHAHVELHGGLEVEAGDEVLVHGDPIRDFGCRVQKNVVTSLNLILD